MTLPQGRPPPSLAAAYEDPHLLTFHLDDVGSAAGRAAQLADPDQRVITQDAVFTVGDFLSAYVLEWTLHHLDLIAHMRGMTGPPVDGLVHSRRMLEQIAGAPFPESITDSDALMIGTGRRQPKAEESALLGVIAPRLPFVLG